MDSKLKKMKLAFRASVWKGLPQKEKKKKTGEFELFKKIAEERSILVAGDMRYVKAKHLDKEWKEDVKAIFLEDLTPTNFSHIKPKWMYPELRLDPSNIELVSRAFHEWQHTQQIAQVEYPN